MLRHLLAVALGGYVLLQMNVMAMPAYDRRASVCNGHPELCGRSYGNVTYLTSHDSFGISTNPLALARNQEIDLTAQMQLGVRTLQAQSHMKDGVLHFCHTSCALLDGGPVLDFLRTVKSFMDANPNEVFTFIFTNPEGASVKDIWDPLFVQSGLKDLVFTPANPATPLKASDWPTLAQMIDSGKKLVVFLDSGANTEVVPYILPEFDYIWEAPFSSTDSSFPCRVDRISGPLSPQDHMFMINHNLNTQIWPLKAKRTSLTSSPRGLFDDIGNAINDAIDNGVDTITNGINQGLSNLDSVTADFIQKTNEALSTASSAVDTTILIPDFLGAPITNGVPSIIADADGCTQFSGGKAPSFVLLDFVNIGEGMKAVNLLNGFA